LYLPLFHAASRSDAAVERRSLEKYSVRASGESRASASEPALLTASPSGRGSPHVAPSRNAMNRSMSCAGARLDPKTTKDSSGATAGSTSLVVPPLNGSACGGSKRPSCQDAR